MSSADYDRHLRAELDLFQVDPERGRRRRDRLAFLAIQPAAQDGEDYLESGRESIDFEDIHVLRTSRLALARPSLRTVSGFQSRRPPVSSERRRRQASDAACRLSSSFPAAENLRDVYLEKYSPLPGHLLAPHREKRSEAAIKNIADGLRFRQSWLCTSLALRQDDSSLSCD
jgi:hypothetical protein